MRQGEVQRDFEATAELLRRTADDCEPAIVAAAAVVEAALRAGKKVLVCGNGGSAADSQHFAAELMGHLSHDISRPAMAAIALTTDTSFLTAYANDESFDLVFARQVEGLGAPGDVLVAISTSGSSANVLAAVRTASAAGLKTIGLTGPEGELAGLVDTAVVVPSRDTQRIQEALLPVEHAICGMVEAALHGPHG